MVDKPLEGFVPNQSLFVSGMPHVKRSLTGVMDNKTGKILHCTVLSATAVVDGVETLLDPDNPAHEKWFKHNIDEED